jgi:ribulose-phosphate 3-epimerase
LLNLHARIQSALTAGIDVVHVDERDSRMPLLAGLGPEFVAAIREAFTHLSIDVHLFTSLAAERALSFYKAGASRVFVDASALDFLEATETIARAGLDLGIALRPDTALDAIGEALPLASGLLLLTVSPGERGQPLLPLALPRISRARRIVRDRCELVVDGGVYVESIHALAAAGATTAVVGSAFFGADGKGDCSLAANCLWRAAFKRCS